MHQLSFKTYLFQFSFVMLTLLSVALPFITRADDSTLLQVASFRQAPVTVKPGADVIDAPDSDIKVKPKFNTNVLTFVELPSPLEVVQKAPLPYQEVTAVTFNQLVLKFDKSLDPSSLVNAVTLERHHPNPAQLDGLLHVAPGQGAQVLTFTPQQALDEASIYRVRIKGGPDGVRAQDNNYLAEDQVWIFFTADPNEPVPTWACTDRCFGTRNQSSFQNDWMDILPFSTQASQEFNSAMAKHYQQVYFYNMKNALPAFTYCDGCKESGGLDTTHFAYIGTHGFTSNNDACLAFWGEDKYTCTNKHSWRFGDNSSQLAFLATKSCGTLKIDAHTSKRWIDVFRGGLILALGSHGSFHDAGSGDALSFYLEEGEPVKWAWFDSLIFDSSFEQDVAVMATGKPTAHFDGAGDCAYRRDHATWDNFMSLARWRDLDITNLCVSFIDDY